jgi:hypothetical protein
VWCEFPQFYCSRMMVIMWFSGLRGAIAYALSLHLEFEEETRKVRQLLTLNFSIKAKDIEEAYRAVFSVLLRILLKERGPNMRISAQSFLHHGSPFGWATYGLAENYFFYLWCSLWMYFRRKSHEAHEHCAASVYCF